jgi:lariat debranching enzyme
MYFLILIHCASIYIDTSHLWNRLSRSHQTGKPIDLLLCCGDFQSFRNKADFHSTSIPSKYMSLGTFPHYYNSEKIAPILTVFIGGNHEASQPLKELYYGGWVAPNIYYLGSCGVIQFGGLRIGGLSGIYKSMDYTLGQYEQPPYDRSSLKSIYHVRNVDVYRMKCLLPPPPSSISSSQSKTEAELEKQRIRQRPIDLMMSHDWPLGIEQYGDTQRLIQQKPYFKQEIERNDLGSIPNREILDTIRPQYWFAAHLHVKFQATVVWADTSSSNNAMKKTKTNDTGIDSIQHLSPPGQPPPPQQQRINSLIPSQTVRMGKGMVLNNKPDHVSQEEEDVQDRTTVTTATTTPSTTSTPGERKLDSIRTVPEDETDDVHSGGVTSDEVGTTKNSNTPMNVKNDNDKHDDDHERSTRRIASTKDTTTTPPPPPTTTSTMGKTEFWGLESSKCNTAMGDLTEQMTRFLALDKCLPRRQFLCILNIPIPSSSSSAVESSKEQEDGMVDYPARKKKKNDVDVDSDRNNNNYDLMNKEENGKEKEEENSDDVPKQGEAKKKKNKVDRPRKFHLEYDLEWLAILRKTHHLSNPKPTRVHIPNDDGRVTMIDHTDLDWIRTRFQEERRRRNTSANHDDDHDCNDADNNDDDDDDESDGDDDALLRIPRNFAMTVPPHTDPAFTGRGQQSSSCRPLPAMGNPQTDRLLDILQLNHIVTRPHDPEFTLDRISAHLQGIPYNMQQHRQQPQEHHQTHEHSTSIEATIRGGNGTPIVTVPPIHDNDDNEIDIEDDDDDDKNDKVVVVVDNPNVSQCDDNEIDIDDLENE